MRPAFRVLPSLFVLGLVLSSSCRTPTPVVSITERLTTIRGPSEQFVLRRVVRLEDRNLALGTIAKIMEHGPTGDLFLMDVGWSAAVYRFDGEGHFLRTYPVAVGPDPKQNLLEDFALSDTHLYVLTQRSVLRLRLDNGEADASLIPPPIPLHIVRSGSSICLMVSSVGLACYDSALRPTYTASTPDVAHYNDLLYMQPSPLAAPRANVVLLARTYSPDVVLFDLESQTTSILRFPFSTWDERRFDSLFVRPKGHTFRQFVARIRPSLRRMTKVFSLAGGRVLAVDGGVGGADKSLIVLDLATLTARRTEGVFGPPVPSHGRRIDPLDLALGSSSTGLVGVIPSDEVAEALSTLWPGAALCKGAWQCLSFFDLGTR